MRVADTQRETYVGLKLVPPDRTTAHNKPASRQHL